MSTINDKWYQEYLRTQFHRDLRRYGLLDLQPSDLDDLRQDLAEHYCEEIAKKHNYTKAQELQAYFSTMLRRRMCKWAMKRARENKRMRTNQTVETAIRESGGINIGHRVYQNMNKDYLATVILFYHANFSVEDLAKFSGKTPKAINRKLEKAREIMRANMNSVN
jgi:DNA-directed RNA polymerase specialized sigma24 family protein